MQIMRHPRVLASHVADRFLTAGQGGEDPSLGFGRAGITPDARQSEPRQGRVAGRWHRASGAWSASGAMRARGGGLGHSRRDEKAQWQNLVLELVLI